MTKIFPIVALSLALAVPAAAAPIVSDSPKSQKLDQLFQDLKNPVSGADALHDEEQISALWMDSGDAAVNQQLQAAMQAMDNTYYDSALKVLNNILAVRPDYVEAWNKRATLYYMVGDYQDSLADIAQALVLEPRHFGAIAGKGMVELKLGNDQLALDAFRQAVAIDPALDNIKTEIRLLEQKLTVQPQRNG